MAKQLSPVPITKKKLLVVEGNDEKIFFEELFKHMAKEDIVDIQGVFIMPDNKNSGMLEDLCLETVKYEKGMECVNRFIICANRLEKPPKEKDIAKAKVQAFLAIMPGVFDKAGLGAQKGYWDFDSAPLEPLKNFLSELVT